MPAVDSRLQPRHAGRALRLVWDASPGHTLASLVIVVLQGVLPLASLYILKLIVDAVQTAGGGGPAFAGIAWLIALAGGVVLFGNLLQSLSTWITEAQAQDVTDLMQRLLQTKSTEVDLAFFENPTYRDTLHRSQREGAGRPIQIVRGLVEVARSGISLAAVGGLLLSFHWIVAPILLATALPAVALRVRYARHLHAWQRDSTPAERQADYLSWLMSGEKSAREVRLFDLGPLLRDRFRALRRRLVRGKLHLVAWRARADLLAQATNTVGVFGAFAFMAHRTVLGAMTLGDLVVFYTAFQRAQAYLQEILLGTATVYENNLFLADVFEFLDLPVAIGCPAQPVAVPAVLREGITFAGVHFTYPGSQRPVLEDIDLTIRRGETVALVGENGSGKTTLIKLLSRFYDPTHGTIHLDGVDVRRFDPAQLRRQISVIFQDYVWYHLFTAAENIWLGRVDQPPDRQRITDAARRGGADEFVRSLPLGYDTVMGRLFLNGQELSVGQWQRLALARAFYREAQLLILDEPSSALDPKAEAEVFDRFRQLSERQTTILVSHRLANVRTADRIHVLDRGRIVESGTHDELMQAGGAYRFLFEAQARHYR
jgi:ATP-binding cassette subfamily B protein